MADSEPIVITPSLIRGDITFHWNRDDTEMETILDIVSLLDVCLRNVGFKANFYSEVSKENTKFSAVISRLTELDSAPPPDKEVEKEYMDKLLTDEGQKELQQIRENPPQPTKPKKVDLIAILSRKK